jgi:hypothetical protein
MQQMFINKLAHGRALQNQNPKRKKIDNLTEKELPLN